MSIGSLGGVYGPPGVIPRPPGPDNTGEAIAQKPLAAQTQGAQAQPHGPSAEFSGTGELSVDPPPGTDPDLWSVLTADERRYFAQARAMGPVTYSPGTLGLAEVGLQRGGRLDVKV